MATTCADLIGVPGAARARRVWLQPPRGWDRAGKTDAASAEAAPWA
jgi:hypothetical protein